MKTFVSFLLVMACATIVHAETWSQQQARFKKEIEARYNKEREADKKRLANLTKPQPVKRASAPGFFYTDQFGVQRYYDPK
jgi:hypothetical protein